MRPLFKVEIFNYVKVISLTVFSLFTFFGMSQNFVNGDFENTTNCFISPCSPAYNIISCVDGWWYFDTPGSTDFASLRYLCFGLISFQNDCSKGQRGLWLQQGNPLTSVPSNSQRYGTINPYYNGNPNALYKLNLDIVPFASEVGIYIHVFGSHNPTGASGAPTFLGATKDPIYFTNANNCWNRDIFINADFCNGDDALTKFEYLIFGISSMSSQGFLSSPAPSVAAVMDNVSICKVFDFNLLDECQETCLEITYNSNCQLCVGESCNFSGVLDYGEETLVTFDYPETSWSSYKECFTIPENATELELAFGVSPNGDEDIYIVCNTLEVTTCDDLDIQSNTTWDLSSNPVPFDNIKTLTVESGNTLTIDAGVTIFFCEDGELIIEPNARLNLYGALTSQCPDGWKGVQVQGNGTTHQFIQAGVYAQGTIECHPGSKIENAITAVKLYGPDYGDAGGKIYADGASFINNSRGVDFARFNNYYYSGTPRDYQSSINNCIFDITEEYSLSKPFTEHINMYRVMGIPLYGNSFANHLFIPEASSPKQYGIGIKSVDGGFRVGSSLIDPCASEVCSLHSSFYGLGFGIYVGRTGPTRPFSVHQAEFTDCFIGVENNGVSGADIVLNEFTMGNTHELSGDEDQIGISLSGYMAKFSVQENKFIQHGDNADFMLGIKAEYLGEMNNEIRRNIFDGLTIGNEAFAICADVGNEAYRGLNYLCNENSNVEMNDFYLPQSSWPDYINEWQGLIGGQAIIATGNTFSLTSGDPLDGDFGNYSDWGFDAIQQEWKLKYFYDDNISAETPVDYFQIHTLDAGPNTCLSNYCPHPCLDDEGVGFEKADFYSNSDEYKIAYNNDDFQLAAYYRNQLDSNIYHILGYLEFDTSSLTRDTLRAWYKRSLTLAGDLMLAGDYTYTEEYTRAIETLDSIPIRHSITASQQFDIDRLKTAYGILSVKSVFNLSSSEIDSLYLYSMGYGVSHSVSRSILAIIDSLFTPRYFVPGEINPRSIKEYEEKVINIPKITVYPNPTTNILFIDTGTIPVDRVEFYDIFGRKVWSSMIIKGRNELDLGIAIINPGIKYYRIYNGDQFVSAGSLLILN